MKYKLGILGLGKMGSSILSGIINSNLYIKNEVLLYDANENVKNKLKNEGYNVSIDEQDLFDNVESVIIAIKPQMFFHLEKLDLKKLDLVVISIAAGKTISNLRQIFGEQKFIRVMPNTPALLQYASSAIAKDKNVDDETFKNVKKIFSSIGFVEEISEDKMNEIIPVNGSMPAYLYYFVEAFLEEAVNEGLDYEVSKKLACEAIIGSCKMIMESGKPTDELIKDVCSPGGATLAGLKVLEDEEFKKIIKDAYKACVKRAYELS